MNTQQAIEKFRSGKTAEEIRAEIAALQTVLAKQEEAEAKAARASDAKRATALLAAMRQCMKEIEGLFPGTFEGGVWEQLTPQSWPRDTKFRRLADLSETEIHSARDAGKKAVSSLQKG